MKSEVEVTATDEGWRTLVSELLSDERHCEFNANSRSAQRSYVVTVKRMQLFGAVFTTLAARKLHDLIKQGEQIRIGGNVYWIGTSFRQPFLNLVRNARTTPGQSLEVLSMTIQYPRGIVCIVSNQEEDLYSLAASILPEDLSVDAESLHGLSRDEGRKIGHAAKDKSQLRNQLITLETLEHLEAAGNEIAEDAVTKDRVLPKPTVDQLREEGISPAIAYLLIHVRRMLPKKPPKHSEARKQYVTLLPALVDALKSCKSLEDVQELLGSSELASALKNSELCTSQLSSLMRKSRFGFFSVGALKGQRLNEVETVPQESAWQIVARALSFQGGKADPEGPPMPTRVALTLSQLRRVGPERPVANVSRLINGHGYTGVEQGNWVSSRESEPLVQWVADSSADLEMLLGAWVPDLNRRGNIGLALGARGSGKSSAHYESSLRVINLTKTRGDGSLAHEYGHFLDHMIAGYSDGTTQRFLSERIAEGGVARNRISKAMKALCGAFGLIPAETDLHGDPTGSRRYQRNWVLAAWENAKEDPQATFDALAKQYPKQFYTGRASERNSKVLANSIARWTEADVTIKATTVNESTFLKEAKKLGVYWKRPCELFARAFESWCEDELDRQGMKNQYLVDQTRCDYSRCKGLPYPVGTEREALHRAMHQLIHACREEFLQHTS